jgi:hypothetical protein
MHLKAVISCCCCFGERVSTIFVILAVKSDQSELVMLMESLLQRYREDKAVWRHQYKALIAHEYLLRHGSAKFVEACDLLMRWVYYGSAEGLFAAELHRCIFAIHLVSLNVDA